MCASWWVAVSALAWSACLDTPVEAEPAVARLIVAWDPLGCGEPHRVVVELADDDGAERSAGAPCNLGGVALDLAHLGAFHGRIYAWAIAAPIRSVTPLEVTIDQPIVQWHVETPR